VDIPLNTTGVAFDSDPAKTIFLTDIATTVNTTLKRLNVVVAATATSGNITYSKVSFDFLPPATTSEIAANDLYNALASAADNATSIFHAGTYTRYYIPSIGLSRSLLLLCDDKQIRSTCPISTSGGLSAGGVAGIVIGVVAFVVVVGILCVWRKRKN